MNFFYKKNRITFWAGFNILAQVAVPFATAFTPVIAATGEQHEQKHTELLSAQRPQVHTLGADETLNVPLTPGLDAHQDRRLLATAQNNDNAQQLKVAKLASQTGAFLTSHPDRDTAAAIARGGVMSEASSAIQQWLSHFGTARIQLDADKNLSLKNSQFDLLLPLYNQGDNLVFTQGSLHRTDNRTQANLGAGLRHFTPKYMLGGNLFGDYDLSQDHARMGVGVEYWRDFLKLGVNGYMRLSGWRDSPDVVDYQARPANGWDVRAQAWLPALPQLGGALTYEQYYGKEVALFGNDNRQKNPHTITAGINYTPVPLISLGAERSQGASGKNNTQLSVGIHYQLGVPWHHQVDPTAVAAMRSLAGSRYDLVERNNNIVLEYRKKTVIQLKTAALVTGQAGELKSLGVSVTSKYGLSYIDWSAGNLIAAGGKIVQTGGDYEVVLPPYKSSPQAINTYSVSGIAVDVKGNRSESSDIQVTVLSPDISQETSTFTPTSSILPSNELSSQVLTLTLKDTHDQPVDVPVKDITLKHSALNSAKVSPLIRKSAGVYTVTVTAGKDNETVTLTPSVDGITLPSAKVIISDGMVPDAGLSLFTAEPASIVANDTNTLELKLVAKSVDGHVLTRLQDRLAFVVKDSRGDALSVGAIKESSEKGTYTATLKGRKAGQYTVVPEFDGSVIGSLSATVMLTAGEPDSAMSSIAMGGKRFTVGESMDVLVTLKDAQGNAVIGQARLLTPENIAVPGAKIYSEWRDNGDGTYKAMYRAEKAGDDLQAKMQLPNWHQDDTSAPYSIIPETRYDTASAHASGFIYPADQHFPATAFTGAKFALVPDNGRQASDYDWKTEDLGISIGSNGTVLFKSKILLNSLVRIQGVPKDGKGKQIEYTFTLKSWFAVGPLSAISWDDANNYCNSIGARLPRVFDLTKKGVVGFVDDTLFNTWGPLATEYPKSFRDASYWTRPHDNLPPPSEHVRVDLENGVIQRVFPIVTSAYTVCRFN